MQVLQAPRELWATLVKRAFMAKLAKLERKAQPETPEIRELRMWARVATVSKELKGHLEIRAILEQLGQKVLADRQFFIYYLICKSYMTVEINAIKTIKPENY